MKEGKADNEHSNPLFYCPSPLNSQHLHFQFTVASLSKFFAGSRCNWEKNCREGSRHSPSTNPTASQTVAFFSLRNRRIQKTLRQTFASKEKCLRPVKNDCAQPLHLEKNVAAYEKCSIPTFGPEEKCLRPMKNVCAC
jgi:hypothetical protein